MLAVTWQHSDIRLNEVPLFRLTHLDLSLIRHKNNGYNPLYFVVLLLAHIMLEPFPAHYLNLVLLALIGLLVNQPHLPCHNLQKHLEYNQK